MGSWNDFLVPAIPPKKSIPPGKSSTRIKRLLLPEEMLTVQKDEMINKDGKWTGNSYKVLLPELYNASKIVSQREEKLIDEEKMTDEGRMILQKDLMINKDDKVIGNSPRTISHSGEKMMVQEEKILQTDENLKNKDGKVISNSPWMISHSGEKMMVQEEKKILQTDENLKNKDGKVIGEEKSTALLYRKMMKTKRPANFTLVTNNVHPTCDCKGLKTGCTTQRCTCIYFGQECQEGCGCITSCPNMALTRKENKRLRIGISPIHGLGCFSMEDIIKGEFVAEYTGEIVSRTEANNAKNPSKFLFETGDKDYLLDASRFGSELAKMNHRRGKGANCEFRLKRVAGAWRAGVWALEDIGAGDELFVDYGDNYRGHGLVTPYIKKARLG